MPASSRRFIVSTLAAPGGKKKRVNRQLEYEQWRLIASLEHLLAGTRALLGQ